MTKEIPVDFIKHKSCKSIVYSWYRLKDNKPTSTLVNLNGFTDRKINKEGPISKAIEVASAYKMWGYCVYSKKSKVIHYWVSEEANSYMVLGLFCHELAHAGGFRGEKIPQSVSAIAGFALDICSKLFPDRFSVNPKYINYARNRKKVSSKKR